MRRSLAPYVALVIGLAWGCASDPMPEVDSGTTTDAAPSDAAADAAPSDAAMPTDAAPTDAAPSTDADVIDANAPLDADVFVDAEIPIDADTPLDAAMPDSDMGADAAIPDSDMGADAGAMSDDLGVDMSLSMSDLGVDMGAPGMDMGFDAGPRVPGDRCETAIAIGAGTTSGTLAGAVNDYGFGTNCVGATGPDVFYAIDVPAGFVLSVSITRTSGGAFDPAISLIAGAACSATPRVCLAGDDAGGADAVNLVRWSNRSGAPAQVFAAVETSLSSGGSFSLTVTLTPIPAGDVCANAIPLSVGTTTGSTEGATQDYGSGTNCTATSGADVAYSVTVPAGQRAVLSVVSADGFFNPSISLVAGPAERCDITPRTCIASTDAGSATTVDTVRFVNEAATPVEIFAIVDASSSTTRGPFTLTFALETPGPGELCTSATTIGAGTTTGTTVGASNDYGSGSGCSGTQGADVVYAIEVPASQRAVVSVTSSDGIFDPSLNLVDGPAAGCSATPRVCVASSNRSGATLTETARFVNPDTAPRVVYAVVDSANMTATGPFSITVSFETVLAGESCGVAERVTAGTYTPTLTGYARDFASSFDCNTHDGADRVHVVSVGAGQTLTATATSSAFDVVLHLESPCGATPRVCLDSTDLSVTGSETAVYTNTGAAPLDVFLVVGSFDTSTTGDYALDVRVMP